MEDRDDDDGDDDDDDRGSNKETYGFKSRKCPPRIDEMKAFENDVYGMIEDVAFRETSNSFQQTLKRDLKRIKDSDRVFVAADKSRNLCSMPADKYKKLVIENVTKSYKKAADDTYAQINAEAGKLAKKLELDDRMEVLARSQAFITLKDHKPNFADKLPCRLINPAKPEMGIVSRKIVAGIVEKLRGKMCTNLWKNTASVVEWFKGIDQKDRHTFIVFDIVDFYASISKDLLQKALAYARRHTAVTQDDIDIIMHARKSLLFNQDQAWVKKDDSGFDVTMGSYDGAEVSELIGAFILDQLEPILGRKSAGLYRDDGLSILKGTSGPAADRLRKKII